MSSSTIVLPATAHVHVFPSKSTIGLNVAKRVADISSNAIQERGRVLVAISGGSLPSILASGLLATTEGGDDASTIASTIDWSKWDVFFADERIVPLDHDDSNYQECNKVMFSKVAGSKEATADLLTRVHTITMGNPADIAASYQTEVEAALDSSGGAFDLVLLGMGPMDMEWSKLVELEHPWYQGVKLYTINRGAKHNSESQQRYLNYLENFI